MVIDAAVSWMRTPMYCGCDGDCGDSGLGAALMASGGVAGKSMTFSQEPSSCMVVRGCAGEMSKAFGLTSSAAKDAVAASLSVNVLTVGGKARGGRAVKVRLEEKSDGGEARMSVRGVEGRGHGAEGWMRRCRAR